MKFSTANNHKNRAVQEVKYLHSISRIMGLSSSECNSRYMKILEGISRCPAWVRYYVTGYHDALREIDYQHHLIFGGYYGGKFYSTHSNRSDYYETCGISPKEFALNSKDRGHYWDCGQRGMKPYFVSNT